MAAGAAGVAVFAAVVVMAAGVDARFVTVNVKGPPTAPAVVFCNVKVGGLGALVNVHTIRAKGLRLVVGTVITLPANVPKAAGFPDVAALVSVHMAAERSKLLLAASVSVTGVVMLVTDTELSVAGAAVPAAVVEMVGTVPARFVAVKLKGPPGKSVVIFCTATSGMAALTIFVKTQVICARARMLVAGIVS